MKITSELPTEVCPLELDWGQVDTNADLHFKVVFAPALTLEPRIAESSDEFKSRTLLYLLRQRYAIEPQKPRRPTPPDWLMPMAHVIDADFRDRRVVTVDQATEHDIQLRSGLGNIGSGRAILKRFLFPFVFQHHVPPGPIHRDSVNEEIQDQYSLAHGGGTLFWGSEFEVEHLAVGTAESIAKYIYLNQSLRRQTRDLCHYESPDDILLRYNTHTVHQTPEYFQTFEEPRRFMRDFVSIVPVEETPS